MICPRSPEGTVRPWTPFEPIEHRQRPRETTASAASIPPPAAVPLPNAATSAITATAAACTAAPATNTHLRYVTRTTRGVRKACGSMEPVSRIGRSEEHTSELKSRFDLVCRLLLEKKKKQDKRRNTRGTPTKRHRS